MGVKIDQQIESPMSMPAGFVVKMGSKMRSALLGSRLVPVSFIANQESTRFRRVPK
jgi:hypothetical protein